ncbi:hypothetical protein OESDEN_24234 [Oesophagostomum dentatum]|uniref:Uncharacterized protein n=1 Tax=Oesophagostomum dentatum TaxID=61180 RepID=A0A0B1RY85_OESDE|nr:hypothetical protein OESDEN_24234 [Oesophagostomum dentatum]
MGCRKRSSLGRSLRSSSRHHFTNGSQALRARVDGPTFCGRTIRT